ncbi:MAG TPA: tetratricopeptide repeat protein [Candidatus Atribacteria bacterium]|nr:tetratricopeptide repeat protein [Candidatus Atribacteria bacterium]
MKKILFYLIISVLVISWGGGWLRAEENLFDQAMEARGKGEDEEALKIFERCVEEGIEVHQAYYEMGKILLDQKKYRRAIIVSEKAIEAYKEHLKNHPEDHNAWWELGDIYGTRSNYNYSDEWKEAQEALEKAVELSPSNSFYLLYLGWIYYQEGDNEKAESIFRKILDKNPEDFQARRFLIDALIEEGRKKEAKEELAFILEKCPKEDELYSWAEKKWEELEGENQ